MGMSIQTNVNSLIAQENLRVNTDFQGQTIQRLTSGYRINSSADDAAGLAVANRFRSDTAELSQGVRNANDGISQLQIIDGGLNNISKMLDRMKTLATQSASTTFSGDRTTLDTEFQSLVTEIDRQSTNIKLNSGGTYNTSIGVYIGGATSSANSNATVSVDLSANSSAVDSTSLGLKTQSIASGAAIGFGAQTTNGTDKYLSGAANAAITFTFNIQNYASPLTVTVNGSVAGITRDTALSSLNQGLAGSGITASYVNDQLAFTSSKAFTASTGALTGANTFATASTSVANTALNSYNGVGAITLGADKFTVTNLDTGKSVNVNIGTYAGAPAAQTGIVNDVNTAANSIGVYAVADATAVNGFRIMSSSKFTLTRLAGAVDFAGTNDTSGNGKIGAAVGALNMSAGTGTTASVAGANSALAAVQAAVSTLGKVQGIVGAGQNKLQYAISLAQSQISSYSAAESRIRDADVAAEAANLTKAQVLQQASIAAMAQANSAPQAVLSLLKG
jgi:flagellin